jgi:hypothetical protein
LEGRRREKNAKDHSGAGVAPKGIEARLTDMIRAGIAKTS